MEEPTSKNLENFLYQINDLTTKAETLKKFEIDINSSDSSTLPTEIKSLTWLENSPVCTKILDRDFNLKYMSKSGVEMLKIKDIESQYGKPYPLNFYADSFKIPIKKCLDEVRKSNEPLTQEAAILDADGNELWFETTIIPINDEHGNIDYFMAVSVDITARKNTEQKILRSQSFNESLLKTSPDIIYVYDLEERKNVYNNNGNLNVLGYTMQEIDDFGNELISRIMHPEDFETYKNKSLPKYKYVKDGEIIESIYRIKHKNSEWRWLHSRESVFKRSDNGEVKQVIGIASDITTQKKVEEKLRKTQERLQKTFDLSPSIIALVDLEKGYFLEANAAVTRMLGHTIEEFTSRPFLDFIHPDEKERTSKAASKKIQGNTISAYVNRYRCKDGNYKWISWEGTQMNSNGIVTAIGTDITQQKEQLLFLELINDIEKSILGKVDIHEISWVIINRIAEYLKSDDCVIYLVDTEKNVLEQIAAYGNKVNGESKIENKISIPVGMGIVGNVAKSGIGEIINDTTKDDRYIVDDKRRLSEITVPLIYEGNVIGIIDSEHSEKNHFTNEHLKTLESIASSVSIQLKSALNFSERKKTEEKNEKLLAELKEREEFLNLTGEIAKVGGWELDLIDQTVKWSRETKRIHEVSDSYEPGLERAIKFYHPEDQNLVKALVEKAIENGEAFNYESRIITAKGKLKHVKAIGQPVFEDGVCVRLYGAFQDISEQHKKDEELEKYRKELENENVHLRKEISLSFNFEDMVYASDQISHVLTSVEQVSATDANVLILGETGTGKELIAKAIHKTSSRKNNSLIRVNCGAIPSELIESELFGHVKGSFTGAISNRIGKFELADGGTLFLDEIGELPMALQPKLLRALQEGEIEPIGSSRVKKLDVRIIAATNKDLVKEIERKRFREDLYFRLNVFPIKIPPLRERIDDIPVLTDHFVNKYSKRHGKDIKYIADGTMQKMMQYNWPGNVRELENLIERAVIISTDDILFLEGFASSSKEKTTILNQRITLAQAQKDHILKTLIASNWKIDGKGGAAEVLDIKPSTLRDRMKKLGISRPK